MATTSPAKEPTETPSKPPPLISQSPITPLPVKPETPTTTTTTTATATATPRPPDPPPSDADVVHVPSYSRWFSWSKIHGCEVRFVPEFFDSASQSKNPRLYMYYRNSIVKQFRANPSRKLTFTDARKTLVGDVGSIRRVFDFLEAWGLVNYSPSAHNKPLKWEDKESKSDAKGGGGAAATVESSAAAASNRESSNKVVCSGCKLVCSIACFACDKYDLTLCARCYVRGNYRVGVNSSDFRRVEISEDMKADWTEKETLYLLEAIMHYGDDWKRVAQLVGGRSEKECVAQFIKLPFGEQYLKYPDSGEVDNKCNAVKDQVDAGCGLESSGASFSSKRMRLTPLADASNPIMAQAAFLSTLAGVDVAEAAARAAVTSLSQVGHGANREHLGTLARNTKLQEADVASNGDTTQSALDGAFVEANSQIHKEQLDVERAISEITQQMKEIQNKLVRFEDLDLQMEKEWQQMEQMKNMLFVDQLALLFHRSSEERMLGKGSDSREAVFTAETILPGNFSVLNLDRNHSKLFVGGLQPTFGAQEGIVEVSLEGQVEDLMLGSTLVGLWDFIYSSGENSGSIERDKFKDINNNHTIYQMMGEGFFTISPTGATNPKSFIIINIKSTSPSGLIFLAINEDTNNFMSIELENGAIVSKVKSGDGDPKTFTSIKSSYNDNQWHKIELSRDNKLFSIKFDTKDDEKLIGACDGTMLDFQDSKYFYFGGYPSNHNIKGLSKTHFDGCLKDIQTKAGPVSLRNFELSYGFLLGCQDKVINIVSFKSSRSYVKWSNAFTSDNLIELILKFNTSSPDGLLAYSENGSEGSSFFSLRIESGILIFESGGVKVSSAQLSTRYDDSQWHVVFVAHTSSQLVLFIDDYDYFTSDRSPKPVRILKGDFYFGGVSPDVNAAVSISPSFIGCIGDITFNGQIVDFNQLTSEHGAVLGRCNGSPLVGSDKNPNRTHPKPTLLEDEDTTTIAPVQKTTETPVQITTKTPPVDECKLPAIPLKDPELNSKSGFRFGNLVGSRFEYDSLELESDSEISVDVKTSNPNGIIFYQSTGTDVMAIYLKEGKVYYKLSCNYVPTSIIAQQSIDDGEWHSVRWTRSNVNAELFIDDTLVGTSGEMKECELNTDSPFYFGGTNPTDFGRIIASIDMNDTFQGCLRDFRVNSAPIGQPSRRVGVSQCSEKVESGAFFFEKGGSIKLIDRFVMSKESQTIKMDVKPRSVNGVLMSLETSKNYFVLEMKNGTILFSVVNAGKDAKEPMTASITPPYSLCNGEWHTIEAIKIKNRMKLGINKEYKEHQFYGRMSHSVKGNPLFIGGDSPQNRNDQSKRYLGCIRNIEISDYKVDRITAQMIRGNVTLSVCPTI